jgi:potassium efflux system protein
MSDEARQAVIDIYDTALLRLLDGENDRVNTARFKNEREAAAAEIAKLEANIAEIRNRLSDPSNDLLEDFADLSLLELEQQLSNTVAEAGALRNAKKTDEAARALLEQRPNLARAELTDVQQKITELNSQISLLSTEDQSPQEKAGLALAQSTLYARRHRARALEQEIAAIPFQSDILDKNIVLKAVQILQSEGIIGALQIETGSARTMNAEQQFNDAEQAMASAADLHPYVQEYARENLDLTIQLGRLVESDPDMPLNEARIRSQLDQVISDANFTEKLLSNEKVSKNYGAILRQLRQKQPSISRIRARIKSRSSRLEDALFQRILNQEELQAFNASPVDFEAEIRSYEFQKMRGEEEIKPFPAISEEDMETLNNLQDYRRGYLSDLAAFSTQRANKLEEVNDLETQLLNDALALCETLDGRLLWLPSTEPVGLDWPVKVFAGITQTFSPVNTGRTWRALVSGFKSSYAFAIIGLVLAGVFIVIRERMSPIIADMSKRVGRVQKDSYVLTPIAVMDGIAWAAPWALIPLALGLFLIGAANGDEFVTSVVEVCFVLAGLLMVLLTMYAWSQKSALFDLHFRVEQDLRLRLLKHLPWFLAVQALGMVIINVTHGNFDFDSGAAALGVLGFLIGSIGISVFAVKLYWTRKNSFRRKFTESDGIYVRNEKWFFILALVLPLITSVLAIVGYYETARLLLWRIVISFCILMIAYVVHGLAKRSVVIAQRRLALEHAKARRDQAIKIRSDKLAAEERGEIPMPQLDYEQIDLETINRQSSQLVNVAVVVTAAAVLWALWSNLLPALSVFNDVEVWGYDILGSDGNTLIDDTSGQPLHKSITLWNVMQAFGIGLITWLAARNLPGFLEIFILKRLNFAQSSRFAIVTVLGYIIIIIGGLMAFDKLGIQWSRLQWVVAALGVGIGFGLQEIIANFISGLIILFERPVRIGDYVTIGENSGTVTRIQIRATTLIDLDNKEILIPNKALVTERVTNWTLTNPVTRLKINVGIAYGSDTEQAHATILETIKKNANVLSNPEPTVLFLGFGDSSLDFQIRVFLRDFAQRFMVSHELHMAVDQALRSAGIEIPFPQRDLHIKNPDFKVIGETAPTKTAPKRKTVAKKKPAGP